jgi:hypothetical protein
VIAHDHSELQRRQPRALGPIRKQVHARRIRDKGTCENRRSHRNLLDPESQHLNALRHPIRITVPG